MNHSTQHRANKLKNIYSQYFQKKERKPTFFDAQWSGRVERAGVTFRTVLSSRGRWFCFSSCGNIQRRSWLTHPTTTTTTPPSAIRSPVTARELDLPAVVTRAGGMRVEQVGGACISQETGVTGGADHDTITRRKDKSYSYSLETTGNSVYEGQKLSHVLIVLSHKGSNTDDGFLLVLVTATLV